MVHNSKTAPFDLSYLAVILLLAYLLTSAPRYLRQITDGKEELRKDQVSPIKGILKLGKYYGIDPYVRALNNLMPQQDQTKPTGTPVNLATIKNPASR